MVMGKVGVELRWSVKGRRRWVERGGSDFRKKTWKKKKGTREESFERNEERILEERK